MVIEIGLGIVCLILVIYCVMFKSERDVARCERDLLVRLSEHNTSFVKCVRGFTRSVKSLEENIDG